MSARKKSLRNFLSFYTHPRVVSMLFFGIASGLPLLLVTSTLYKWLMEEGLSRSLIYTFSTATLPYSTKIFWAHLVDQAKLPILRKLGQYRSWFLFSQIGIILSVILLRGIDPTEHVAWMWGAVFCVAFFSATQDIAFGAYRVHTLNKEEQAFGSSMMVIGYRIGILIAGSGALFLSNYMPWTSVYIVCCFMMIIGPITVMLNPEPIVKPLKKRDEIKFYQLNKVMRILYKEFFCKKPWLVILIYIFFAKLGDATFNAFTWVFLAQVGFSNTDLSIVIALGFLAASIGAALSGIVMAKFKLIRSLIITTFLQVGLFILLTIHAVMGKSWPLMTAVLMFENFAAGFAAGCLYTFFAYITSKKFSAIQYTFFASFFSFSKVVIVFIGGQYSDYVSWESFFGTLAIITLASVGLLFYIARKGLDREGFG